MTVKAAAALAASSFLVLLLLSLTWPGSGVWLLFVGFLSAIGSGVVWTQQRSRAEQSRREQAASYASSSMSGISSMSGMQRLRSADVQRTRDSRTKLSVTAVLVPMSVLAFVMFAGGALGSEEAATAAEVEPVVQGTVTAIDRSRDGEPATPQADPPSAQEVQPPVTLASATVGTEEEVPAPAPLRPITVAEPTAAAPDDGNEEEFDLAPQAANTFEYVVEDGDSLYGIAERYSAPVDVILNLNGLSTSSFIHPGDVLLIPIAEDGNG